MPRKLLSLILLISVIIAACTTPSPDTAVLPTTVPTTAPLAGVPTTAPPTQTVLPPTRDLSIGENAATPTPVPTKPTPTPEPVESGINITAPSDNSILIIGDSIRVRGLAERSPDQTVWVSLISQTGRLLVEIQAATGDLGWEATFPVPNIATGAATLQAAVRAADGSLIIQDTAPVTLTLPAEPTDRFVTIGRPANGATAVAGYYVFFDGSVYLPFANTLSIAIWANDCQDRVAVQSYVLGSSSRPFPWRGFVAIPRTLDNVDFDSPACAVASFGEPGSDSYREAAVALDILPPDAAAARGVTIGNPAPDAVLTAGSEVTVYGAALNAGDSDISVSILLENGRVLGQATVTADYFGYWEAPFALPGDVSGPAQITALVGQAGDDNHAGNEILVTINPIEPEE